MSPLDEQNTGETVKERARLWFANTLRKASAYYRLLEGAARSTSGVARMATKPFQGVKEIRDLYSTLGMSFAAALLAIDLAVVGADLWTGTNEFMFAKTDIWGKK